MIDKESSIYFLEWLLHKTNIVISQNDKGFFYEDYETKFQITSEDIFIKYEYYRFYGENIEV